MENELAVQWLVKNMPSISQYIPLGVTLEFQAKIDKAKEIEKEQKIMFANQFAEAVMGGCLLSPTEFYNETFKS